MPTAWLAGEMAGTGAQSYYSNSLYHVPPLRVYNFANLPDHVQYLNMNNFRKVKHNYRCRRVVYKGIDITAIVTAL